MENLKDDVASKGGGATVGLDLQEISRGFVIPDSHLTNPKCVGDSMQEQNSQTYIQVHQHAFGCDSTDNEVMWWLESQSCAYTWGFSLLFVSTKVGIDRGNHQTSLKSRNKDQL